MRETSSAKGRIAAICAIVLALVFLISGGWKVLAPFHAGELLEEARVPTGMGTLGAVTLGTVELFAVFLLVVPAFRKWGGLLSVALMGFFMLWIGYYYQALVGKECSCFPFIKRAVNPMFFVEDGILLLLSVLVWLWAPAVRRFRIPALAFVALAALASVSFAVNAQARGRIEVPSPIIADGKPDDLTHGKVLIFFFDPSCEHCEAAARFMSTLKWNDARIVALPTVNPQWAASFLHDTHLKAETSDELDKMRKAFTFGDPPYGVALEDGRVKGRFGPMQFTPPQPEQQLRALGFIQ